VKCVPPSTRRVVPRRGLWHQTVQERDLLFIRPSAAFSSAVPKHSDKSNAQSVRRCSRPGTSAPPPLS